jgi:ABC-type Mn2+/Zn2+ transport system ATPase subunit
MIKFYYLKKTNVLLCGLIAIKYTFWSAFFLLQGHAIEMALSGKSGQMSRLICVLFFYVLIKLMVMLCDVGYEMIQSLLKNKEMNTQWHYLYPYRLYSDNVGKKNEFKLLIFEYIPEIFFSKSLLFSNRFTIIYIALLATIYFVNTKFYIGFLMLLFLFLLNYISKNIFGKKIDNQQRHTQKLSQHVVNWSDQYFNGYQEIVKNWKPTVYASWHKHVYKTLYQSQLRLTVYYAIRDLICQLLVELPFVFNTALIIFAVYTHYLSIAQLFVWIGMSQFIITASNALAKNKIVARRVALLDGLAKKIIRVFSVANPPLQLASRELNMSVSVDIKLQDGTLNKLSLLPGLYHLKGQNGSGKTTFLDQIKGFNRSESVSYSENIKYFISHANRKNIRLIDRNAILFDNLPSFCKQIAGPLFHDDEQWMKLIEKNMAIFVPASISTAWIHILGDLQAKYDGILDYQLSLGEHIILSFARAWFYWNTAVQLLLIDECDSLLDMEKRSLFIETIRLVSVKIPVYIVSHSDFFSKSSGDI